MKNLKFFFQSFFCLLSITIQAQNTTEIINFDVADNSERLDTISYNAGGLWAKSVPNKAILQGAYSPAYALVTDAKNSYPVNSKSSFTVAMHPGESIFFKHKFDTEKGKDGLSIEISDDNGLNWSPILDPNCSSYCFVKNASYPFFVIPPSIAKNDTLFNGTYGFSGSQTAWRKDSITVCYLAVKTSFEFLFRFTFQSDNIFDNKDGWMIDDIEIREYYNCPSDVFEINAAQSYIYPNPASENSILQISSKENTVATMSIYDLLGQKVLSENVSLIIGQNQIPLSATKLSQGIYSVQLNTNSMHSSASLVVQ
ncbi:MAG: T9SS type A sorting domain-containing protein [Bacteroidetes bacterium]|nr:T9SS type A sorting domain-containing protein [Bacteroidota bacterium]